MDSDTEQTQKIFALGAPFGDGLQGKLFSIVRNPLEKVLLLDQLNNLYARVTFKESEPHFTDKVLEAMQITYSVSGCDLSSIPRQGPLVIVANHPFGGIEGILLASIIRNVRPDFKMLANQLLHCIPEMRDLLIYVDPFDRKDSLLKNLKPLREAIAWLRDGHVLGVFPAGTVSHLQVRELRVSDPRWYSGIARIVRKTNAPVLPVFFDGANSTLFHLAGLVHPKLRTALLPHELLNKTKRQIEVRVGNVIPYKRLETFDADEKLLSYLRLRTYLLKYRENENIAPAKGAPMFLKKQEPRDPERIATSPNSDLVAEEVKRLPAEHCLLENGNYAVMQAKAHQIPNLLYEIGRLREITFRQVGEGTGRAVDLDRYDLYYTHLFLWNKEKQEVVGGYRLGQMDLILERFGKKGLYTSSLFDYKEDFFRHVEAGVELGRSFVRLEYQKLYSPLLLLWKGIGHFIARNPRYCMLFGPVTISNAYDSLSRQIMVSFLTINHFAPDLARFIKPKASARTLSTRKRHLQLSSGLPEDIEELSALISDVEKDHKGVPVLLRQYVKLGGKLMAFGIDSSFSNGLDGLLLVDLRKCDRKILERYMGGTGSAAFLDYHGLHDGLHEEPPTLDLAS